MQTGGLRMTSGKQGSVMDFIRRATDRVALARRQQQRRTAWERRWSDSGYSPAYELGEADAMVRKAVDDDWFRPGMRVIDIGCGVGHNAAWLAQQGLGAVGIDFQAAVERARAAYADIPQLSFEAVDVTKTGSYRETFDALLDRGCLHGLDLLMHRNYVENLEAWARPGAHFLLIMRDKGRGPEEVVHHAKRLLVPSFTHVVDSDVVEDLGGPKARAALPGVAMRFVRAS
jgi:cyclopropane fatty-acyl-phospholipid synthase-like methyltransferase